MSLKISNDPAPLATGSDGVVRVGGTRVRLDTIINAFNQGASAEEILQQYPSVTLSDIYATISYYLQHREEVDSYLTERGHRREELRAQFNPQGIREKLLARRRDVA